MNDHHKPRLLFVVNVDGFFLSHRLPIAMAAREHGIEVVVATAETGKSETIRAHGFEFVPLPLSRKGRNPITELHSILSLKKIYSKYKPDLIHHVTIKPILYGSIAARLCGDIPVINAISGMGYVFTKGKRARLTKLAVRILYRIAFSHPRSKAIFQNPEDRSEFQKDGLIKESNSVLIRGSGVDLNKFTFSPEPSGVPVVVFPARLLLDKGLLEFIEAAAILKKKGFNARFVLVGDIDPFNPATAHENQVRSWEASGKIEWWGFRDDMPEVFRQSSIVALPTYYREGLPKSLLEAAASGRPIVTTDVRGCREVVKHGQNGLLIPAQDSGSLAAAIEVLLLDAERRMNYGIEGRRIAEESFSIEMVVQQTLDLYRKMLAEKWPDVEV